MNAIIDVSSLIFLLKIFPYYFIFLVFWGEMLQNPYIFVIFSETSWTILIQSFKTKH